MCRAVVAVVFGMACLLAVAPLPSQSEVLTSLIVDLASANGATLNADLNSDIEFSCNQAFAYKIYMVTKEAFDSCDLTIASRRVLTVADVCTPGGSVNRTLSPISDGVTNVSTQTQVQLTHIYTLAKHSPVFPAFYSHLMKRNSAAPTVLPPRFLPYLPRTKTTDY